MVVYEIYYKDILLGHLYIRDGQHRYIPIVETIEVAVRCRAFLFREVIQDYQWGKPIPFFQQRIENAKRFGMEKNIYRHTDNYVMRMVYSKEQSAPAEENHWRKKAAKSSD